MAIYESALTMLAEREERAEAEIQKLDDLLGTADRNHDWQLMEVIGKKIARANGRLKEVQDIRTELIHMHRAGGE